MNPTDEPTWDELAGALFDEVIVPLAQARRDASIAAFGSAERDAGMATYFSEPGAPSISGTEFATSWGDAAGLVEALLVHWNDLGDSDLQVLGPRFIEIAERLAEEPAESDGSVDVLCYTLF
nr:hypothetical protein [uncultured bacterium]